ncbi:hypothetical protein J6590_099864, partial [Homalodisca vitripennis]
MYSSTAHTTSVITGCGTMFGQYRPIPKDLNLSLIRHLSLRDHAMPTKSRQHLLDTDTGHAEVKTAAHLQTRGSPARSDPA